MSPASFAVLRGENGEIKPLSAAAEVVGGQ